MDNVIYRDGFYEASYKRFGDQYSLKVQNAKCQTTGEYFPRVILSIS